VSVSKRLASLGTLAVTAALVAGACNSGTPSTAPTTAPSAAPAGSTAASQEAAVATTAATPAATQAAAGGSVKGANIFVVGGKPDDAFWSKVKKGVDDEAAVVKAYGGNVTWLAPQNYDNLGPDAAKLIQNALTQNPSGIIGPDWVPEAEDPAFQAVVAAKVPLIIYNAGGIDAANKLGALTYVGNDEYAAGVGGGEYLGKAGVKNILCVNTLPGTANIEARCKGLGDGVAKSGGKMTELPLPSSQFGDQSAIAQAVKAALANDPTLDAAVTISAGDATAAASGIDQAGLTGKVKLGSFDFDSTALTRIKGGQQLMAIDQQPYLQGMLSVALLNAYILFGNDLPTKPVGTGPGIVDASNVDVVIAGAAAGAR
jgi:simple sugar transport system substrate-binding protein